ncbi:3-hydroxyacyl-CoA dehydrogenase NAD-binding domain-containing protein [Actinopolyspora erythraea]|uniref:3-hydroxyacyl-CoA dehydrogenase NAD-binding domain-containing protein n=1 Tax=Actinopolyspora erythraea TaxID=414996 RepID=UPI0006935DB4|nr:3-hydroxyacyl-CoA dehydrogenase NAD-binding domain-containing protein [Actinopolyspora erythraea]
MTERGDHRFETAAVLGAGTIGLAWAGLFAAHGMRVRLSDPRSDLRHTLDETLPQLTPGLPGEPDPALLRERIELGDDTAWAVSGADLVQENGPERLEFKRELLAEAARAAPEHAVLASSSSGLLPSRMAEPLPEEVAARVLVAHPFNPPHIVPLVELVPGERTSEGVVDAAFAFYTELGKTPVRLRREVPGFVANRLQSAVMAESFGLVLRGVIGVEELDTVMKNSLGGRWATVGPFESFHLGGGGEGIRHMIEHLGRGMAERWKDLSAPELTESAVETLVRQTESAYGTGTETYLARSRARDDKQLAVNEAVRDAGRADRTARRRTSSALGSDRS